MRRCRQLGVLVALGLITSSVLATPSDDAAAANKAVEALRRTLMKLPAVQVSTTLTLSVVQGEVRGDEQKVEAKFTFVKDGYGAVALRDYNCWFEDGTFRAVHKGNLDAFFETEFDGNAYWTLWDLFRDLPWPHVGLLWGEPDTSDMLMQLHPKTPELQPVEVSERDIANKPTRVIRLEGPAGTLELHVDPATGLLRSATHRITSGTFVQAGAEIESLYVFDVKPLTAPPELPSLEGRQRVDMFRALAPAPERAAPKADPGGGIAAGPGGLVGQAAPDFVLSTLDGDAIALDDLKGKVVVLDFWATWCGPCIRALPQLAEVAEWADDAGLPVVVYAINTFEASNPVQDTPDARLEAVRKFWKARGLSLPVLMDFTDEVAGSYGVQGIPATFIIRSDGVLHAQHTGAGSDYGKTLRADIEAALKAVEGGE